MGAPSRDGLAGAEAPAPSGRGPADGIPSAFAPGPWSVYWHRSHTKGEPYQLTGSDGEKILRWGAFIKPTSNRAKANARLIAAAPDLYDALAYITLYHTTGGHEGDPDEAKRRSEAALTKARGETL